jgi:hypothetical protein
VVTNVVPVWPQREPKGMKRGKTIKLRLTGEEYSAWEGKARAAGMTLSEWIRRRCASAGRPIAASHAGDAWGPSPGPRQFQKRRYSSST